MRHRGLKCATEGEEAQISLFAGSKAAKPSVNKENTSPRQIRQFCQTAMLLVEVGAHTINVEQVLAFHDDGSSVRIMFAAEADNGDRYSIELTGDEAERMRAWLDRNAEGVRGNERAGFHID